MDELEAGARLRETLLTRSASLVLAGEPGIGKTTVWSAIVSLAEAANIRVLSCRPSETESSMPFAGLADLLEGVDDELLAQLPRPQRRALEVALLRVESDGGTLDRRAILSGFASLLGALAAETPVLLAADDLQWLDVPSQGALEFALRRTGQRPIGLLGSVRVSDTPALTIGLSRTLDEIGAERVLLGPMTVAALHEIIASQLGTNLSRPVLVKLVSASRGNPFYALEIAREMARRGEPLPDQALPVPADLRELIRARVVRLPRRTQAELLTVAACVSPHLGLVDIQPLEAAEDAGLVAIDGSSVRFSHPLFASAVYESASAAKKQAVHRRLAELVTDPDERVRHLALGASRPDERVASELEQAAAREAARGAPESGAELMEYALAFSERTGTQWATRAVAAAEHHFHAGDRERARSLVEQTLAATEDRSVRCRALRALGELSYHADSYREARELFQQALELADERTLIVQLHVDLQIISWHLGDRLASADHGQAAVELATKLSDDGLLAMALASAAAADYYLDRPVSRARLESALELEDSARPLAMAARPSLIVGFLALMLDDFDWAESILAELRHRAVESGQESDLAGLNANLSCLERLRGRAELALRYADEGCEVARMLGSEIGVAEMFAERCHVWATVGDVERARADAELVRSAAAVADVGFAAICLANAVGFLELSRGDTPAAAAALEPVAATVEQVDHCDGMFALGLPDAIEALIASGQRERAHALVARLERHASNQSRASVFARAARCRALLAAADDELDGACRQIEQALREHEKLPMPLELGRSLLVQGSLLRRQRNKRRAREVLERAREIFDSLGARLWVERANEELRRIGGRRAAAAGELSATEMAVARLVAAGHTNQEVAASLHLSPRTVEWNLSKLYRKLDVRSRTQLSRTLFHDEPARDGAAREPVSPLTSPPRPQPPPG